MPQGYERLTKLWTLRLLTRVGGHRNFLKEGHCEDDRTLEVLGITLQGRKYDRGEIREELFALAARCERAVSRPPATAALSVNLLWLERQLGLLPVDLTWVDSRDQPFAPDLPDLPDGVYCEHSDPVQGAVAHLVPQSRVLVMSFSHAEDLAIVEACLRRQRVQGDLPFLGLIGSKTKWATFRHRLKAKGFSEAELARVTCPIGIAGIHDKRPEVIAAAVAAQLLLLAS